MRQLNSNPLVSIESVGFAFLLGGENIGNIG